MRKFYLFIFVVFLIFTTKNIFSDGIKVNSSSKDDGKTSSIFANLSGTYYIGAPGTGPGGTDPQFPTFRAALDTINDATIVGDCIFYFTSDITETYADSRGIGLAINPEPYSITFKPYTGRQPVITFNYPTDLNAGPSGAFIIGIPGKGNISWDSLRTTKNIIFDGSNTVGGTTRDLTFTTATTAQRNAFPMAIVGDVSNVIIKNMKIYYKAAGLGSTSGNLFLGAIQVRSRNYLGIDWVPRNIIIENNHLSGNFDDVALNAQGYVTYQTGTPLPADYPYNITLKNNLIEGKRRGIALYRAGSHDIYENEIILNQNIAANVTSEAIYAVDVDTNSVINIQRNKISKVSGITNAANMGNTAISIESFGTYYVFNNFIYGFDLTASNPVAFARGIKNSSASATLHCYFNSIYMPIITSGGTITYEGILISNGTNHIKNNIIVSGAIGFASYCINRAGTSGTLTSDYNDFYCVDAVNGYVGMWNSVATQTLGAWQTASSQDANSLSVNPLFTSFTDLHLSTNTSPVVGKGTPIEGVNKDIDNETRDVPPEIGADEFPGYVPVELISFNYSLNGNTVTLKWSTSSETNNKGFEVERKSSNSTSFEVIGFINGNGNSVELKNYEYTDASLKAGNYSYRLKQIDFDGTFKYSEVVNVEIGIPFGYSLEQNYPNPFNPNTNIVFSLPVSSNISLKVYSLNGELVRVISEGYHEAGHHTYNFNADGLSSGTYFYQLIAGDVVISKKMTVIK